MSKDPLCMPYEKTGACPKGELCRQIHRTPDLPRCLVFHHIYADPDLFVEMLPEGTLEISGKQKQNLIDAFYLDCFLMLRNFGQLDDMVLCGNKSDHLTGNLIVMYREVNGAMSAFHCLNGQYYAGRRIAVTLAPVLRLSNAVCRSFSDGQCQLGNQCNFVHALNPSKHVMTECFPKGLRAFALPFRKVKTYRIMDSPTDLLYGQTKMRRQEDEMD
jgi:splicing factor U2AF subunit